MFTPAWSHGCPGAQRGAGDAVRQRHRLVPTEHRPASRGDELAAHDPWFNQTLTTVNDAVVRLGIIEDDFHWHKHDAQDEFLCVLDGRLIIDIENRETVTLERHQGSTVPRGVIHRTRSSERTAILMVEAAGVVPTGD